MSSVTEAEGDASIYGVMAAFETPEKLKEAVAESRRQGFTFLEAYSPYPIEDLTSLLGGRKDPVAVISLIGGLSGALLGFGMMAISAVYSYPLDVGGRPLFSWPSFIPITFELTVLGAALSAVFSMLIFNGLPRLHHPVFHVKNFERASEDLFILCIQSKDPNFQLERARIFLERLQPIWIEEAPR